MKRRSDDWVDETRRCLREIGKYFRDHGSPVSVEAISLERHLKGKGYDDSIIGIATSGIYFQAG